MYTDIGMEETLKKIFGAVIAGGIRRDNPYLEQKQEVFRTCVPKFLATFPSNIFQNEYAFFYEVLTTLKVKVFSEQQLRILIEQNSDLILNSPYIDFSQWAFTTDGKQATPDEKVEAFANSLLEAYKELSNMYVTVEEFESACNIYINYFIEKTMFETVQNMALILSDTGYMERKPHGKTITYKGLDDAQRYYNEKLKLIRELSETEKIQMRVIDYAWLEDELQKEDIGDTEGILDFGIEEIDKVMGKLRRSYMLGILGPPKGGKTRMANYLVCRALERGLNVAVWPLEGTVEEWVAMQIAAMIRMTSGQSLEDKQITERIYDNDDIKQLVLSAKARLATDYTRGKLSFITGTAYVEDFIDILQAHYDNENAFDVIVIDSLVNILSKSKKTKVERISEAYMLLKDFIANKLPRKAIAIVPAQLKQDVINYLRKNPGETIDVTSGGESAETVRSPDEVIGLFSTKEERNTGKMRIYSVASRHSANFDDFYVRCELGCCYFYSDPSLNE